MHVLIFVGPWLPTILPQPSCSSPSSPLRQGDVHTHISRFFAIRFVCSSRYSTSHGCSVLARVSKLQNWELCHSHSTELRPCSPRNAAGATANEPWWCVRTRRVAFAVGSPVVPFCFRHLSGREKIGCALPSNLLHKTFKLCNLLEVACIRWRG